MQPHQKLSLPTSLFVLGPHLGLERQNLGILGGICKGLGG
jgi:hypothetical protein